MKRRVLFNHEHIIQKKKRFTKKYQYDYFISHASEDKADIVVPVICELDKLGISYFIDTKGIDWGESLQQSLSKGLMRSHYFLAIISESYMAKSWTMTELKAAFHQQVSGRDRFVLLILAGTEKQRIQMLQQLPLLCDLRHLIWGHNSSEIAVLLAERLRLQ